MAFARPNRILSHASDYGRSRGICRDLFVEFSTIIVTRFKSLFFLKRLLRTQDTKGRTRTRTGAARTPIISVPNSENRTEATC